MCFLAWIAWISSPQISGTFYLRVIRRPRAQAAGRLERGVVQLVVRVGPDAGERGQQLRRDGRVRLDLSVENSPVESSKQHDNRSVLSAFREKNARSG